jgi:predicted GH43/DUF377 family glycosyl hydrolase
MVGRQQDHLSPPPIETPQGWLVIYHGVRQTASGSLYRLGLALFDLDNPERCLIRGDEWVFGPEEPYEQRGDVDNVVFPCGTTVAPDGDTLHMYYGAADSSIALATGSIRAILDRPAKGPAKNLRIRLGSACLCSDFTPWG